jgi:hypothetical protein
MDWTLTLTNPCLSTAFATPTVSAMTTTALGPYVGNANDLQTLAWTDTASTSYGNQDGSTLCGARTYSFQSGNGGWITLINSNQLKLLSTAANDDASSPYTVVVKAVLASYTSVTTTASITVTITSCVLTALTPSLTMTTPQSYTLDYQANLVINTPTWTQTPACGKAATEALSTSPALVLAGDVAFSSAAKTLTVSSTNRPSAGAYTLTVTHTITTCVGTPCTATAVMVLNLVDACTITALSTTYTIADMSTTELKAYAASDM